MVDEIENREYTPAEASFSDDLPLGGGITSSVKKVDQEFANREEVAKRNEILNKGVTDQHATMELDVATFSAQRDKAVGKTALNSNWLFNWMDEEEANSRFDKADETGEAVDIQDTLAASILNGNKLSQEYLSVIKGAKTSDGLTARLDWAKNDAEVNGYISKALTEKEIMVTSVASSLATPDMLIGIGAPAMLYGGAKIAQATAKGSKVAATVGSTPFIAAVEFGTEAGINTWHSAVAEDYDMMDAATDTLIYGAVGTAFARMVTPRNMEEVAQNGVHVEAIDPNRIIGEARTTPAQQFITVDGVVTPNRAYVAPIKPKDAIGTAREETQLVLTKEGSVTHPSAVGIVRDGKAPTVDKQAGTVEEWTEATIGGKPVFIYGGAKNETIYKDKETGKVINIKPEPYKAANIYGEAKATENTYVRKDGQIHEVTQTVKGAQRKTHATQTLTESGAVATKKQKEVLDEVVSPAETKAIENIKVKQEEAKLFRKTIVDEINVRVAKAKEIVETETKALKARLADPKATKGQISYREKKIAKAQKTADEATEELRKVDEGHSKTMKEHSDKISAIQKSLDESPKKAEMDEMFNHYLDEPKKHIQALNDFIKTNPDKEYMEAIKTQIEGLRAKFPKEVAEIEALIKAKGGNTTALKSEWYKKLSPHNKKILVTAGVLGGVSAQADDGTTPTDILLILVLGAFGIANRQAISAIFKSKGGMGGKVEALKNSWSKATTGIIHEEGMNNAGAFRKASTAIVEKAYTQLFSASAPFIKAGGAASDFIQKMLYNKDFGGGALTMKNEWFKNAIADYRVSEKNNFRLWMEEQGKTEGKILQNTNEMEAFRELVLDVKEGLVKSDSKAVNNVVKILNEKFSDMLTANKEYKTFGFDKIKFTPEYVPRLWRTAVIQDVLRGLSDLQIEAFAQALSKSIKGENSKKTADKLIKGWMDASSNATKNAKAEVIGMLADKNLLKDEEGIEDILDAITGTKDRASRSKHRIDIDMSTLKKEVNGLGIDELKFNVLLDRSSASVIDKLGNQMYATAALSREGITSSIKLDSMIEEVGKQNKVLGHQAEQIKSLVLGEPMPVDNEFLHTVSNAAKDLTLGGKLPLVALSTPTEILQTLFSNGLFTGLTNLSKAISFKYGKGSELLNQVAKIGSLGRGTDMIDLKYAHRGFSNEFIESGDTAFSQFREGTMKFRDLVIYFSGLSSITDILQIANKFAHTEQLGKMAHGMENGIPLERYTEFGLTPERVASMKPYLNFDKDGTLLKVDLDSMPRKVRDDYQEMMFNMNQAITPETTVGETPLFARTSSLGRIITTLAAYTMQQFNLHGIQGIKRADKYSAIQFMGGVSGTYLGLSARNALLDKEMDDETLLMYSMMNAPQALGLATIKSFLDPAVVKHNKDLMELGDFSQ